MKSYFLFLPLSLLALFLSGCKETEEQDTEKPVIRSATINSQEHDITAPAGNQIHIEAHVTDNEALGEMKVDIHDIFDSHSHKSRLKWADIITIQLSGKEQHVHEHLDVPQDATAGPHHAVFRLIDAEGNEGGFVELDFMISNASQPQIAITDPDFGSEVHAPKGSTLSIMGSISDDTDLAEIRISLTEDHQHKQGSDGPIYDKDFDLNGTADTHWDFQGDGNVNINIPANAETGYYRLEVVAIDNEGNMNIFEAEVHIM